MLRTRFSGARAGAGLAAALVACLAAAPPAHAVRSGEPDGVSCRVRDDPRARVFQLRRSEAGASASKGDGWVLAMRDAESRETWIAIALPGAKPMLTATTAALKYRNANGGRQVDLAVSQADARLEVWVDHGLEVNIEPDLDPRVDRLSTDGVLTNIDCTIDGG